MWKDSEGQGGKESEKGRLLGKEVEERAGWGRNGGGERRTGEGRGGK